MKTSLTLNSSVIVVAIFFSAGHVEAVSCGGKSVSGTSTWKSTAGEASDELETDLMLKAVRRCTNLSKACDPGLVGNLNYKDFKSKPKGPFPKQGTETFAGSVIMGGNGLQYTDGGLVGDPLIIDDNKRKCVEDLTTLKRIYMERVANFTTTDCDHPYPRVIANSRILCVPIGGWFGNGYEGKVNRETDFFCHNTETTTLYQVSGTAEFDCGTPIDKPKPTPTPSPTPTPTPTPSPADPGSENSGDGPLPTPVPSPTDGQNA